MSRIPAPSDPGPRPTRIHRHPCARCPSAHFPPDPESQDIAALPYAERIRHVFPCGWRPQALCRGVCDELGVDASNVAEALLGDA